MKSFITFVVRLIAFIKLVFKGVKPEQHYMAIMLVMLVFVGSIFVEVSKKQEIELERQRQAEMEAIRHDIYVNNEVTRH